MKIKKIKNNYTTGASGIGFGMRGAVIGLTTGILGTGLGIKFV